MCVRSVSRALRARVSSPSQGRAAPRLQRCLRRLQGIVTRDQERSGETSTFWSGGVARSPTPVLVPLPDPRLAGRPPDRHESRLPGPATLRTPVCDDAHAYTAPRHVVRHGSVEACLRRSREVYRGRFIQNAVCGLRKVHLPRTRGIGSLYTAASLLSGTTKTGQ